RLPSKPPDPPTPPALPVLLDFHTSGSPQRGEPSRSELAVTTAISLIHAVYLIGQQIGLVTNARDGAERIRTEGWERDPRSRQEARKTADQVAESKRLEPLVVETRRGPEQLQRTREGLARAELTY